MTEKNEDPRYNTIPEMSAQVTKGLERASDILKNDGAAQAFLWNCQAAWLHRIKEIYDLAANWSSLATRSPEEVETVVKEWMMRYEAGKADRGVKPLSFEKFKGMV